MKETSLQRKIEEVLNKTRMSIVELAKASGTPKVNLYKWYKGATPKNPMVYNKLVSYLDQTLYEYSGPPMAEEPPGEYITQYKAFKVKVSLTDPGKPPEPFGEKAAAGTVRLINNEPYLIADRIDVPFIGTIDAAVELDDDSMAPSFKRGCRAAITRLPDYKILTWGKYFFIIDKNLQGIVRRIYPGNTADTILLVSENAEYPPITRQWDQIEAIFLVTAGILKH